MILVTGATGSNGTEIVKRLAAQNVKVRAMVRNRERASVITEPNVEVVEGDFERPETLLNAQRGVEHAFLLTNSSERAEAQQLSTVLDRRITFVDISPEAMRDTLLSVGFPVWQADGLIEDYAHYRGYEAAAVTSGVKDAIGKEPRSFEIFAHDYMTLFS